MGEKKFYYRKILCIIHTFFPLKFHQKWGWVLYKRTKFSPIFSERVSEYGGSMTANIACYANCTSVD